MFKTIEIGWNYSHPKGIIYVDEYDPPESYSLVLFHSPTIAVIEGKTIEVKPNGMILFAPGSERLYYPKERHTDPDGKWSNDFVKFYNDDKNASEIPDSITLSEPIYLERTEHISRVIKEISELEHHPLKTPEIRRMINNRIEYLLLFIAINLNDNISVQFVNANAAIVRRIRQTRTYIMENPGQAWNVGKMAEKAGVSQSYFFRLYKMIFGTSPMQDLNARRIEKAKYYFSCTVLSIKEVAYKTGFKSECYFTNAFKAATGLTPGNYCKLHQNNDTSNVLYYDPNPER